MPTNRPAGLPDGRDRAWMASAQTNVMLADAVRQGADILGTTTPAGARLQDMSQFLGHVGHDMIQAAEHWWQVVTARRTTDP